MSHISTKLCQLTGALFIVLSLLSRISLSCDIETCRCCENLTSLSLETCCTDAQLFEACSNVCSPDTDSSEYESVMKRRGFLGKRRGFLGKREFEKRRGFLGKRRGFLGKREFEKRRGFLGKREFTKRRGFLGKRSFSKREFA